MATFSVRFLGCKVSYADAQAVRERLLGDGHDEVTGAADVAVVNTCCVTHEAVSKSRQAVSRAALSARARVRDRVRREPRRCLRVRRAERLRGRAAERSGSRRRRRRRRRDRLRPGGCAPRANACVREDPGRLLVLVRVLRHPARARRDAQPQRESRADGDRAARRARSSRDRPHGRQPRLLPRPRGRIHAARGWSARPARCPASSGFASRPSR